MKVPLAMVPKTPFAVAIVLASVLSSSPACAQVLVKAPSLEEIVQRLQANLNHFDTRLPSVMCDEHVSSRVEPDLRNHDTISDFTFRLVRTANPDHTTSFVESRESKSGDGKPVVAREVGGPATLSGLFEGALGIVSLEQAACMKYDLQRVHARKPNGPYLVRFATVSAQENSGNCFLQEDSKGQALIDPASMQLKHLEITTPRHTIVEGTWYASPVIGKRVLTIDYDPVVLGDETFWLPSKVTMRETSGSGTFHTTTWSFQATYRNYHKLQVTWRVHGQPE